MPAGADQAAGQPRLFGGRVRVHGLRIIMARISQDFRFAHGHRAIGLLIADPEILEEAHHPTQLALSRASGRRFYNRPPVAAAQARPMVIRVTKPTLFTSTSFVPAGAICAHVIRKTRGKRTR